MISFKFKFDFSSMSNKRLKIAIELAVASKELSKWCIFVFLLARHTNEYAFLSVFANISVISNAAGIIWSGHYLSSFPRDKKQGEQSVKIIQCCGVEEFV